MDEVSASKPKDAYDDRFSALCGDLGLGEGLKPGGIFRQNSSTSEAEACVYKPTSQSPSSDEKKVNKPLRSDVCHCQHNDSKITLSSTDCCNNTDFSDGCDPDSPKQASSSILKHLVHRKMSKSRSVESQGDCRSPLGTEKETFPTFADVPYGTSLRQQKKLFEQNLDVLKKRHELSVALEMCNEKRKNESEYCNAYLGMAFVEDCSSSFPQRHGKMSCNDFEWLPYSQLFLALS